MTGYATGQHATDGPALTREDGPHDVKRHNQTQSFCDSVKSYSPSCVEYINRIGNIIEL